MEVRDRLESGDVLRENLELVLGDVEAGQLAQLVDLHRQPGQLVVVKPELCKKRDKIQTLCNADPVFIIHMEIL